MELPYENCKVNGIIPTAMICGLIVNKLGNYFSNHHYITQVLDARFKNQNQSNAALNYHHNMNNTGTSSKNTTTTATNDDDNIIDYGDCTLEAWHSYGDDIKKNWVIRLIVRKGNFKEKYWSYNKGLINNNNNNKKMFYIIKRKARFNSWVPISYIDDNNNFRGQAVFTSFWQATEYMRKYEDRLIRNHLKESRRHSNDNQRRLNAAELKIFSENSLPDIRSTVFNRYRLISKYLSIFLQP